MPTYFGATPSISSDYNSDAYAIWNNPSVLEFTCPGSGSQTIKELSAYLHCDSGTPHVRIGIYSSDGSSLVAEGASEITITGSSDNWQGHLMQSAITPNPATLTGGVKYILCMSADNGGTWACDSCVSDTDLCLYKAGDYTGGMPSSVPADPGKGNYLWPVRCGVDPAEEGPTPVNSTPSDSTSTTWSVAVSLLLPILFAVGEASASYTDAIAPLESQQYTLSENYTFHGNVPYADTPSAMEPILCAPDDSNAEYADAVSYESDIADKTITISDSLSPEDSMNPILEMLAGIADIHGPPEDAANGLEPEFADLSDSASDGWDDASDYALILAVSLSDDNAPDDAVSVLESLILEPSDSEDFSDAVSYSTGYEAKNVTLGDSLSPSDSVTAEVEDVLVTCTLQDSFEFTEQVSAQAPELVSVAESNAEYSETVLAESAIPVDVELADEFAPADEVSVVVNTGAWRDAVSFERRLTGPAWRDEVGYDLVTGGFSAKYALPSDSLSWTDSVNYAWPVTVSLWDAIQPYIHLQWDANAETDIDYYNVYWSESAGIDKDNAATYDGVINAGNVTDYVFTDKAAGTYNFAITAVNTGAEESDESNEISSSLAAQDSISYRNPIPVTIAESWTTTDRTPSYIKNDFYVTEEIRVGIGEALAPVDSVQADWGPKYVNISESIATSDDLSILLVKFSSVSESFVPTDTVATSGPQVPVLLSDTLNFWTDAVRFQKNNILVVEVKQAEIEESFDTSDSVSYSLIPYSVRVNAADSWTPSDAVSHGIGYAHSIADSFTPTDTVQFENIEVGGAWPKSYEPSDTWTPSDSVSAQLNHLAAIGDQLNPLDHVHPSFGYGPPAEVFITMQAVNDVQISYALVKDVTITRWPTQ